MENSLHFAGLKKIKVAGIQMNSKVGDIKANCEKILALADRDIEKGTDIILFPEVWTVGWSCKDFRRCAESFDDSIALKTLSSIAIRHNAFVIGGSVIEKREDGRYFNTCPVFDRKGNLIAKYSKTHLFSYYGDNEDEAVEVGENPVMVNLDGINVGLTICYDIRFPEIYRAYRIAGADLLVNCAAWGLHKPIPWECMTRCRSVENQTYMVALTQSGQIQGENWNIGHSRIFDYKGEILSEIKEQKEGAMTAVLDIDEMYQFRKNCTILKDIRKSYEVECV